VADSRSPRDGRFIESLGTYDPCAQPFRVNIEEAKAIEWIRKGAQPTQTVKSLFAKSGVLRKMAEVKGLETL